MVSSQTFNECLTFGKIAESNIANYFLSKGYGVLPIYESSKSYKGPTLFFSDAEVIATDIMVFKGEKAYWIEAKHKTAFTWHRITSRWVTGIDLNHYEHYKHIAQRTSWPVWLMFWHEGGKAKDSPDESPKGLYGNELMFLSENENHRHKNHGRHGMVYWSIDKLKLIKELK